MGTLPKQTIDFSVPNPSATSQLSLPLYRGAAYRVDFKTWALVESGGFMKFNLNISQPIPVSLTLNLCASLVGEQANCPITITVNSKLFVQSYSDHDANWHDKEFVIPRDLLHSGDNEILIRLDYTATTQLFIRAVTVDQAVLKTQTIDFSVPNPQQTAQLSLPLYQGAGYRDDFKTWSLLVNNGFFKLNLSISEAVPVTLTLNLCAALVHGEANCPISITANGNSVANAYRDTNANFHPKAFVIPSNNLKVGDNEIKITLDNNATTQLFINAITVSGE